jgi:hypothetical protein
VKRIVHPEVAKVFWKNRTKVQIYWNLYFGLSNWIKWSCAVILMKHITSKYYTAAKSSIHVNNSGYSLKWHLLCDPLLIMSL